MVNDDSLKPMARYTRVRDCTVWQGDNGWSVMLGWNIDTEEVGMSVTDIHMIHVGHWADGYCYPCSGTSRAATVAPRLRARGGGTAMARFMVGTVGTARSSGSFTEIPGGYQG